MMKAVVMNEGKLSQTTVPIPQPERGELQVKLLYTGVCRTDLHIAKGAVPGVKKDLVMGHEGVGTVSKLGKGADNTLKIGDLVVCPWFGGSCGKCSYCLCGDECYCRDMISTGCNRDGCYAEYVVVRSEAVVPVPQGLAPQQAATMACAGLTVYKALKESGVGAGKSMCVVGAAGGLGNLCMQFAQAMGLKPIGLELGHDKVKFVKDQGFVCLDGAGETYQEELTAMTDGGACGAIVCAPSTKAYQEALRCVRSRGSVVAIGLPPGPVEIDVSSIVKHGIRFVGSIVGTQQDLKEALEFAAEKKVKCVLTERNLEDIAKVHEELETNKFSGRAVCFCGSTTTGAGLAEPIAG